MLLKSRRRNSKATLTMDKAKLILNMILDRLIKVSKTPKFLFGTKRKDKSSKYKLRAA